LGIDWNWVAVTAGALVGAVFGLMAVMTDVPTLVLIAISALGGALVTVAGLMLVFGVVDSTDFTRAAATSHLRDDWWWWITFLVLALGGVWTQARNVAEVRSMMRYDQAVLGH
jgi:xanthosine utilization system XapX-like protein